jgi:starch-binding outer membrane protein, SusD/RagB family
MKRNIIFPILFAFSLMFLACEKTLDTQPGGMTLTESQKKEVYKRDPRKLSAEINGMYGIMKGFDQATGTDIQSDYGFPNLAVMLDHNSQDLVGDVLNYNHYSLNQSYQDRNFTYRFARVFWGIIYLQIKAANDIVNVIDPNTEDATLQSYLGQALAIRAYDYLYLVQAYQFTYVGHQDAPAVPIVLNNTPLEVASNNPRATVQEVYDQIKADLDKAIPLLEGKTRLDKSQLNQGVAYGIRARMNLIMQNWEGAKNDAAKALSVSGESPMSIANVSVPTFDDVTAPGILWGCILTDQDDATKQNICNFTSMFISLCFGNSAYTTSVQCWKKISVLLYNQIPATDVRKGWWLDENYQSPNLAGYEESGEAAATYLAFWGRDYVPSASRPTIWAGLRLRKYTHVKFAPNNKNLLDPLNACDFPLMRAEEMKLIEAEATGMLDLAAGKALLENFVKTYRDPSFASTASTAAAFQDEVWLQRRIELWGEGFAFFDNMRLKKPFIRKDPVTGLTNFGAGAIFNIEAESPCLLWVIPRAEIQSNLGIPDAANNQPGPLPVSETSKKGPVEDDSSMNKIFIGFKQSLN